MIVTVEDIAVNIWVRTDIASMDGETIPMEVLKHISEVSYQSIVNLSDEDIKAYIAGANDETMNKIIVTRVCTLRDAIKEAMRVEACKITTQRLAKMWIRKE